MVYSYRVFVTVRNLRQVLMPEKKVLLVTCTSLQIQSYTEAVSNSKCKILQIKFVLHTPQNDSLMKWNAKI